MADEQNTQAAEAEAEQSTTETSEQAQAENVEQSVDGETSAEQGAKALQQELADAQQALADATDQVLRAQADVQNMRRRAEQDVAKARKFALEKFAEELLPVVDNLERGIESAQNGQADIATIREGSEMTLNMFISALKKFNVEPIDPQDEPFDPQLHQAMSMVENPNVEPNTVLHVMQKGYLLNDRLVRPAMVMVSKGGEKKPDAPKIDEQV